MRPAFALNEPGFLQSGQEPGRGRCGHSDLYSQLPRAEVDPTTANNRRTQLGEEYCSLLKPAPARREHDVRRDEYGEKPSLGCRSSALGRLVGRSDRAIDFLG